MNLESGSRCPDRIARAILKVRGILRRAQGGKNRLLSKMAIELIVRSKMIEAVIGLMRNQPLGDRCPRLQIAQYSANGRTKM